jgi:hypothetical protein
MYSGTEDWRGSQVASTREPKMCGRLSRNRGPGMGSATRIANALECKRFGHPDNSRLSPDNCKVLDIAR